MTSATPPPAPVTPDGDVVSSPPPMPPRRNGWWARAAELRLGYRIGVAWLLLLTIVVFTVHLLPIAAFDEVVGVPMEGLSWSREFLGTDAIGRSMLSRILYAARPSMAVGLFATAIGLVIGGLLGLLAGYFRGLIEAIVDTLAEVVQAFPALLFLMALAAVLRPSLTTLTVSMAVLVVPSFARMMKGNVIAQGGREFVLAARALGASHRRVLFREILPNTAMAMVAFAVIVMALMIVIEGSLSFLGLGIPMPNPSWGGMVAAGKDRMTTDPSQVFLPTFFLFMTVYSLNTVGDQLRKRFDVRQSQL